MIEKIEYRGVWFLPERPRRRISGVLKFFPGERVYLELDGGLQDRAGKEFYSTRPSIILGITSGGDQITLYPCHPKGIKTNIDNVSHSSYSVGFVFIGKHFKKVDDIKTKQFSVRFSNLQGWANISGPSMRRVDETKERNIHCGNSNSIVLAALEDKQINLETSINTHETFDEAIVKQKTYITTKFKEYTPFDECMSILRSIQHFLCISMEEPPFPMEIQMRCKTISQSKVILPDTIINVIYKPILIFDSKEKLGFEMLFTFSDIKERGTDFLTNWFSKYTTLGHVFDLYFAHLHSPFSYSENRFIDIIQALEAYHRRVFGGKYLEDTEYEEHLLKSFINAIPKDIDPDFRNSLVNGKLKYTHEYSLRKRLDDILDRFQPAFPEGIFDSGEKRKQFINRIVDTRNYLTHYDKKGENVITSGTGLYDLEQGLKFLMEIALLKEIGFELAEIKNLISKSHSYQYYSRRLSTR